MTLHTQVYTSDRLLYLKHLVMPNITINHDCTIPCDTKCQLHGNKGPIATGPMATRVCSISQIGQSQTRVSQKITYLSNFALSLIRWNLSISSFRTKACAELNWPECSGGYIYIIEVFLPHAKLTKYTLYQY